jgi:hypothetical protein
MMKQEVTTKKVFIRTFGCQMDKLLHSDFTLLEGAVWQGVIKINYDD